MATNVRAAACDPAFKTPSQKTFVNVRDGILSQAENLHTDTVNDGPFSQSRLLFPLWKYVMFENITANIQNISQIVLFSGGGGKGDIAEWKQRWNYSQRPY